MKSNKKLVYVGGDLMRVPEQWLRDKEKEDIKRLGFDVYSPQDDKEINDKTNQTEDDNNHLAEKIFDKDTTGMINADILVFDVANTSVGTTAEIGQWAMVHRLLQYTADPFIEKLASKPIFFHSSDIRDTDIPESGYRRSHSYNQYLYACTLECNNKGIQNWEEILKEMRGLL